MLLLFFGVTLAEDESLLACTGLMLEARLDSSVCW